MNTFRGCESDLPEQEGCCWGVPGYWLVDLVEQLEVVEQVGFELELVRTIGFVGFCLKL